MSKEKPLYKKGDKVCCLCGIWIDKKNQHLPWFSIQLKEKDKYIKELLEELEKFRKS